MITLYTLDSNFRNDRLVEKYESLIWTERWQTEGDFELVMYEQDAANAQLNVNKWLGMSETHQIMYVTSRSKKTDDSGKSFLTFKGFCGKSIFRNRSAMDTNIYRYSWGGRREGPSYEKFNNQVIRTNIAPNPAFNKEGTKTDQDTHPRWLRSNEYARVSMSGQGMRVEGDSDSTNNSFAHIGTGNDMKWSHNITIQGGRWLGIDAWMVADDPLSGSLHDNAGTIQFYQVVNGNIQRSGAARPTNYTDQPVRRRILVYVQPNATACYLRLYCGASKGNGYIYWSNMIAVQGPTEADVISQLNDGYFDGDSTHFTRFPENEFEFSKDVILQRIVTSMVLDNQMSPYENFSMLTWGAPPGIPGYTTGAVASQSGNYMATASFGDTMYDLITDTAIAIDQGWGVWRNVNTGQLYVCRVRGTDRRIGSSNPLVYATELGNITNTEVLESWRDTYNIAAVYHPQEMLLVGWDGVPGQRPTWTGLTRKVLPVDASDIEMDKNDRRLWAALAHRGLMELHKNGARVFAVDGEVTSNDKNVYESHYALGSLLDFIDDSGERYAMRVTEFTFIHDAEGYKQYPTLEKYNPS